MLDNLLDIEVAYSLLKSGEEDLAKDPLDVNYEKLNTDLEVKKQGFFFFFHSKVIFSQILMFVFINLRFFAKTPRNFL